MWRECRRCKYRELWGCQGGCLTYALMKEGDGWAELEAEGLGLLPF